MSKNLIEIDVVIGEPPNSAQVAKVLLVKKGDLYISQLDPSLIAGKVSYHQSGISHAYRELIKGRSGEGQPAGEKLKGMKGHRLINGWGCPSAPESTGFEPRPDTRSARR